MAIAPKSIWSAAPFTKRLQRERPRARDPICQSASCALRPLVVQLVLRHYLDTKIIGPADIRLGKPGGALGNSTVRNDFHPADADPFIPSRCESQPPAFDRFRCNESSNRCAWIIPRRHAHLGSRADNRALPKRHVPRGCRRAT